jgi:hypothetical protein
MNLGGEGANKPASPAASEVNVPQRAQAPCQPLSQGAAGGVAGGAAGNPVHGELSPAFHAPIVINGQNSREVVCAVGED